MLLFFVLVHLFLAFVFFLYLLVRRQFSFWSDRGIPGPAPKLTSFGNVLHLYGRDPKVAELDFLSKYGNVYGYFVGMQPVLTIADPALIKQIFVKDFNLWPNRRQLNSHDDFLNINIFFADTAEWRKLRALARQMFTSSKLRAKHEIFRQCVTKYTDYLQKCSQKDNGQLDVKNSLVAFTVDVVASSIFTTNIGLSYSAGSHSNQLWSKSAKAFNPNLFQLVSFLTMPKWFNQAFSIGHFFNVDSFNYITSFLKEVLRQRKQKSSKSNDLMNFLLTDARIYGNDLMNEKDDISDGKPQTRNKMTLSDDEILTMCLIFYLAGFETTGLTINYAIYEMAMNPEIQRQLNTELTQALEGIELHSEQYNEIVLNQIAYLDAVVCETLRKYPVLMRVERRLHAEKYHLTDEITLCRDQMIDVPILAMHYRADLFPQPHQFKPERFMPENKHRIVPYSYMPFGAGPRNCLGMRFATQVIKLFLASVCQQFHFSPTESTPKRLNFDQYKFNLNACTFYLNVEQRRK